MRDRGRLHERRPPAEASTRSGDRSESVEPLAAGTRSCAPSSCTRCTRPGARASAPAVRPRYLTWAGRIARRRCRPTPRTIVRRVRLTGLGDGYILRARYYRSSRRVPFSRSRPAARADPPTRSLLLRAPLAVAGEVSSLHVLFRREQAREIQAATRTMTAPARCSLRCREPARETARKSPTWPRSSQVKIRTRAGAHHAVAAASRAPFPLSSGNSTLERRHFSRKLHRGTQ